MAFVAEGLRLELHRIDLSAVVSKYIGKTEKNLRRLFDAAEDGGAVLFFDEADALFGKRSEVKDSHDTYPPLRPRQLLDAIKDFRGVVIFGTAGDTPVAVDLLRSTCFVAMLDELATNR